MATATLGTFFLMARRIAAACAIAFTQPHCGLSNRDDMEAEGYGVYLDQVEDIQ